MPVSPPVAADGGPARSSLEFRLLWSTFVNDAEEEDHTEPTEFLQLDAKAVKDTADGGTVSIVAGGAVVLIVAGHARRPADYVRRQGDVEEGQLTVTKGGAFSKGSIDVTGISAKQTLVNEAIGEFSDKKVNFA